MFHQLAIARDSIVNRLYHEEIPDHIASQGIPPTSSVNDMEKPKILELMASMGPCDNPVPDLEGYTLQMNRMLEWTLSSLNRTQFELLEVCFVVCLELYLKLFNVSPANARTFIQTFKGPFLEKYENHINQLCTFVHPSQLKESPILRMSSPFEKHAMVITKKAKRLLICWLANCESVLIQNILQETVDFIDASELSKSNNMLARAQLAQIYGVDLDWLDKHLYCDGRPFLGLVERQSITESVASGSYIPNPGSVTGMSSCPLAPQLDDSVSVSGESAAKTSVAGGEGGTADQSSAVPDEFSASADLLAGSVDLMVKKNVAISWGLPSVLYGVQAQQTKKLWVIGKENTRLEDSKNLCPLPSEGTDIHSVYKGLLFAQAQNRANVNSRELPYILSYTLDHSHNLTTAKISTHDGRYIAAGYQDSTIRIWDLAASQIYKASGDISSELEHDIGDHLKLKYLGSPEGNTKESNVLFGHDGPVTSLCFGEMGTVLLSGGLDGEIRLYLPSGGSTKVVYKGGGTVIFDLAYSPFGYYFTSVEQDGGVRMWATDRSYCLRVLRSAARACSVSYHPNTSLVAAGCDDGALRLWDLRSAKCQRVFLPPRRCFHGLQRTAFSWNGRFVASTGSGPQGFKTSISSVLIWDIATGRMIDEMFGHQSQIRSLSFSHGCNLLAVASDDDNISIWDTSRACGGNSALIQHNAKTSRNGMARLVKAFSTKNTAVRDTAFTPENVLLTCLVDVLS